MVVARNEYLFYLCHHLDKVSVISYNKVMIMLKLGFGDTDFTNFFTQETWTSMKN